MGTGNSLLMSRLRCEVNVASLPSRFRFRKLSRMRIGMIGSRIGRSLRRMVGQSWLDVAMVVLPKLSIVRMRIDWTKGRISVSSFDLGGRVGLCMVFFLVFRERRSSLMVNW